MVARPQAEMRCEDRAEAVPARADVLVAEIVVQGRASGAIHQVLAAVVHFALSVGSLVGERDTAVDAGVVVAILSDGDACGCVSSYHRYSVAFVCRLC